MPSLANDRVILKFNFSVLVQKFSTWVYNNFILNLYIAYELNNWPRSPTKNFPVKNCLFVTFKLAR